MGRGDGQFLLLPRSQVLSGDVEDAAGVDVIGDLDLRHSPRRRRNAHQVEPTQGDVVASHGPLSLEDVNLNSRLAVLRRREHLVLLHWDGGVPVYEPREDPAQRLHPQAQGRHVQEQDVLHISRQHSALDSGAQGDALHGIHAELGLSADELLEVFPNDGHAGGAADEDDVLHVPILPLGVLEGLLDGT